MNRQSGYNRPRRGLAAALSLVAAALIAGCATPESRLRSGLVDAGLSRPLAACMAERMVDRLSLSQLRRLGALGGVDRGGIGGLSVAQFLDRVGALGDPQIIRVATTSAGICVIGG